MHHHSHTTTAYPDIVVHGRRATLRRKYLSLGAGELAAAAAFAAVTVYVVIPRLASEEDSAALWSALVPLLLILVQAGSYWLLARRWVGQASMPATLAAVYRGFRIIDVVVLAVGLLGVVLWWPDRPGTALMVVAVWVFGLLEYLNYFVVRLSYPIGRWLTSVGEWRTPRLVCDMSPTRR